MSWLKTIIPIAILLCFSYGIKSQPIGELLKDTARVNADSVDAKAMEMEPAAADDREGAHSTDTTLVKNKLVVNADSINGWRNSKHFEYAKNLDSLLYAYQQTLEGEGMDAKVRPSWLDRFFSSPITTWFFWILAGVFIFVLLYKLFFTKGFFQPSYTATNVRVLTEEGDNLSINADYGKLITVSLGNRNYRLAVRYHYLQTLQMLSLKGLIAFASDKTNYQYVRELEGNPNKKDFASLTLDYEYVWYGAFEINEIIFISIQNKFKQFNTGISK